jgi:hypothetical protein
MIEPGTRFLSLEHCELLPQGSRLQGKFVAWYEEGMNIRDVRKTGGDPLLHVSWIASTTERTWAQLLTFRADEILRTHRERTRLWNSHAEDAPAKTEFGKGIQKSMEQPERLPTVTSSWPRNAFSNEMRAKMESQLRHRPSERQRRRDSIMQSETEDSAQIALMLWLLKVAKTAASDFTNVVELTYCDGRLWHTAGTFDSEHPLTTVQGMTRCSNIGNEEYHSASQMNSPHQDRLRKQAVIYHRSSFPFWPVLCSLTGIDDGADYKKDCLGCHIPAKADDWIYVKGYPVLHSK